MAKKLSERYRKQVLSLAKEIYDKVAKVCFENCGDEKELFDRAYINVPTGGFFKFNLENREEFPLTYFYKYMGNEESYETLKEMFYYCDFLDTGFGRWGIADCIVQLPDGISIHTSSGKDRWDSENEKEGPFTKEYMNTIITYLKELRALCDNLEYDHERTRRVGNLSYTYKCDRHKAILLEELSNLPAGKQTLPVIDAAVDWWVKALKETTPSLTEEKLNKFRENASQYFFELISDYPTADSVYCESYGPISTFCSCGTKAGIRQDEFPKNITMNISLYEVTVQVGSGLTYRDNSVPKQVLYHKDYEIEKYLYYGPNQEMKLVQEQKG